MVCTQPRRWSFLLASAALSVGCAGGKSGGSGGGADPLADTVPPVIALLGEAAVVVPYGSAYTDAGATAVDDVDGEVPVTVTGVVDPASLGTVVLSYDAVDAAGNAAETVTRTVDVVDVTPPVITLTAAAELTVSEGDVFSDPGAVAVDDVDGEVVVTVVGSVDADRAGTYTLTYEAVDASGNAAEPVERVVVVRFDGTLAVAASGASLALIGQYPDGRLTLRATADIPLEGLGYTTNHVIFGMALHPTSGDVYVSSMAECGAYPLPADGCWGNARIDRFSYSLHGLVYEGPAALLQGPLRYLEPELSADLTEVSLTLFHQGEDPVEMVAVSLRTGADATLASGCDGVTLSPGDTCELTISHASDASFELALQLETSESRMLTEAYLDLTEGHLYHSTEWKLPSAMAAGDCFASGGWNASQVGTCAPTAIAISPDGNRLYVNEDSVDRGLTFGVEADGSLTFLSQQRVGGIDYQGMAVSLDGSTVYNGAFVLSTDSDELRYVDRTFEYSWETGGNATEVFSVDGFEVMATTISNARLALYDLSEPQAPVVVDSVVPEVGKARYQHHSADASRFVTIDHASLVLYDFALGQLQEAVSLDAAPVIDDSACTVCDYFAFQRSVQMAESGDRLLVSVAVNAYDEATVLALPHLGQVRSFVVDPGTGVPTEVDTVALEGMSRAVLNVPVVE